MGNLGSYSRSFKNSLLGIKVSRQDTDFAIRAKYLAEDQILFVNYLMATVFSESKPTLAKVAVAQILKFILTQFLTVLFFHFFNADYVFNLSCLKSFNTNLENVILVKRAQSACKLVQILMRKSLIISGGALSVELS